jgi:hypothetical protein
LSSGEIRFDHVVGLWEEGLRRLREIDPAERYLVERVIDAVIDELRRRLGGGFRAQELAELYFQQGTDWCFDIAMRVAPDTPAAWDMTTVVGAAFAQYLRSSSDYAGGRRLISDEE